MFRRGFFDHISAILFYLFCAFWHILKFFYFFCQILLTNIFLCATISLRFRKTEAEPRVQMHKLLNAPLSVQ